MSVREIQIALTQLPAGELDVLIEWIENFRADAWDTQIESDAAAGKLDAMAAEALAEHRAGKTVQITCA